MAADSASGLGSGALSDQYAFLEKESAENQDAGDKNLTCELCGKKPSKAITFILGFGCDRSDRIDCVGTVAKT